MPLSVKKKRPKFRPVTKRKVTPGSSGAKKGANSISIASTTKNSVPSIDGSGDSKPDNSVQQQILSADNNDKKSSSSNSASILRSAALNGAKRGKKRKAIGGSIAIGASRIRSPSSLAEAVVVSPIGGGEGDGDRKVGLDNKTESQAIINLVEEEEEPKGPIIPPAKPGDLKLSAYCTAFRENKPPRRRKKKDGEEQTETGIVGEGADNNKNQNDNPSSSNKNKEIASSLNKENKKKSSDDKEAQTVQIIDGEIVIQGEEGSANNGEEEYQEVVVEESQLAIVGASYSSFVKRTKPQHWNAAETKIFYEALRQVGLDFMLMESYFTNRTRKQLKRKYHSELTKNSHLIDMALDPSYKKAIDLSVFDVTKEDISKAKITAKEGEQRWKEESEKKAKEDAKKKANAELTKSMDEEALVVVEEDNMDSNVDQFGFNNSNNNNGFSNDFTSSTSNQASFWADDDELGGVGGADDPMFGDEPMLEDSHFMGGDEFGDHPMSEKTTVEEEPTSISLMPTKSNKKKKKPKFRSKKGGGIKKK